MSAETQQDEQTVAVINECTYIAQLIEACGLPANCRVKFSLQFVASSGSVARTSPEIDSQNESSNMERLAIGVAKSSQFAPEPTQAATVSTTHRVDSAGSVVAKPSSLTLVNSPNSSSLDNASSSMSLPAKKPPPPQHIMSSTTKRKHPDVTSIVVKLVACCTAGAHDGLSDELCPVHDATEICNMSSDNSRDGRLETTSNLDPGAAAALSATDFFCSCSRALPPRDGADTDVPFSAICSIGKTSGSVFGAKWLSLVPETELAQQSLYSKKKSKATVDTPGAGIRVRIAWSCDGIATSTVGLVGDTPTTKFMHNAFMGNKLSAKELSASILNKPLSDEREKEFSTTASQVVERTDMNLRNVIDGPFPVKLSSSSNNTSAATVAEQQQDTSTVDGQRNVATSTGAPTASAASIHPPISTPLSSSEATTSELSPSATAAAAHALISGASVTTSSAVAPPADVSLAGSSDATQLTSTVNRIEQMLSDFARNFHARLSNIEGRLETMERRQAVITSQLKMEELSPFSRSQLQSANNSREIEFSATAAPIGNNNNSANSSSQQQQQARQSSAGRASSSVGGTPKQQNHANNSVSRLTPFQQYHLEKQKHQRHPNQPKSSVLKYHSDPATTTAPMDKQQQSNSKRASPLNKDHRSVVPLSNKKQNSNSPLLLDNSLRDEEEEEQRTTTNTGSRESTPDSDEVDFSIIVDRKRQKKEQEEFKRRQHLAAAQAQAKKGASPPKTTPVPRVIIAATPGGEQVSVPPPANGVAPSNAQSVPASALAAIYEAPTRISCKDQALLAEYQPPEGGPFRNTLPPSVPLARPGGGHQHQQQGGRADSSSKSNEYDQTEMQQQQSSIVCQQLGVSTSGSGGATINENSRHGFHVGNTSQHPAEGTIFLSRVTTEKDDDLLAPGSFKMSMKDLAKDLSLQ